IRICRYTRAVPAPDKDEVVPTGVNNAISNRAYWLKTLHQWHWISSALCLLGMLLFSVTGITLNHAGQIEARPQVRTLDAELPSPLQARLAAAAPQVQEGSRGASGSRAPVPRLPADVEQWVRSEVGADL